MAESFQSNQVLTATLEVQEWNIVLAGLQELAFRISAPVIQKLRQQLMPEETNHKENVDGS